MTLFHPFVLPRPAPVTRDFWSPQCESGKDPRVGCTFFVVPTSLLRSATKPVLPVGRLQSYFKRACLHDKIEPYLHLEHLGLSGTARPKRNLLSQGTVWWDPSYPQWCPGVPTKERRRVQVSGFRGLEGDSSAPPTCCSPWETEVCVLGWNTFRRRVEVWSVPSGALHRHVTSTSSHTHSPQHWGRHCQKSPEPGGLPLRPPGGGTCGEPPVNVPGVPGRLRHSRGPRRSPRVRPRDCPHRSLCPPAPV